MLLFEPHVRRLGVELRLWSASYLLYLLLVFFPQSSIFRLLVPLSPLWGAFALPRSTAWRIGVLAAGLVGAVVVDLQHVRAREYDLAGSVTASSGMPRSAGPQAFRRRIIRRPGRTINLDRQTPDEKEPQWQP